MQSSNEIGPGWEGRLINADMPAFVAALEQYLKGKTYTLVVTILNSPTNTKVWKGVRLELVELMPPTAIVAIHDTVGVASIRPGAEIAWGELGLVIYHQAESGHEWHMIFIPD